MTLVEATLAACFAPELPERLIGDWAYDSDPLDERLAVQGIELIVLHRRNRRRPRTLDLDASGASHIYYLGSPTLGKVNTTGASNVEPK